MRPVKMFSGRSSVSGNRVNLIYWHVNPYVYDRLCDNEWQGPQEIFVKYVINAPWWEWVKEKDLEVYSDMTHLPMDDMYVYTAYTTMMPQDETFWRLKYEVLHKKDIEL